MHHPCHGSASRAGVASPDDGYCAAMSAPGRLAWARRIAPYVAALSIAGGVLTSCSDGKSPFRSGPTPRTYRMGFSQFPPRPDIALLTQTIDLWARRADVGLILTSPPWDSLLAGRAPDSLIRNNQLGLATYYRGKGLRVVVSIDPTNGLDRSAEDPA